MGNRCRAKKGAEKSPASALCGRYEFSRDAAWSDGAQSRRREGRIRAIHFAEGDIPWHEFTVVTAKDIPGKNCIALLIEDQPCLAAEFVNHPEEPVVLLAHHDKYLLEEARRAVRIEIEPLPAIFSIEDSLERKEVIWGQ